MSSSFVFVKILWVFIISLVMHSISRKGGFPTVACEADLDNDYYYYSMEDKLLNDTSETTTTLSPTTIQQHIVYSTNLLGGNNNIEITTTRTNTPLSSTPTATTTTSTTDYNYYEEETSSSSTNLIISIDDTTNSNNNDQAVSTEATINKDKSINVIPSENRYLLTEEDSSSTKAPPFTTTDVRKSVLNDTTTMDTISAGTALLLSNIDATTATTTEKLVIVTPWTRNNRPVDYEVDEKKIAIVTTSYYNNNGDEDGSSSIFSDVDSTSDFDTIFLHGKSEQHPTTDFNFFKSVDSSTIKTTTNDLSEKSSNTFKTVTEVTEDSDSISIAITQIDNTELSDIDKEEEETEVTSTPVTPVLEYNPDATTTTTTTTTTTIPTTTSSQLLDFDITATTQTNIKEATTFDTTAALKSSSTDRSQLLENNSATTRTTQTFVLENFDRFTVDLESLKYIETTSNNYNYNTKSAPVLLDLTTEIISETRVPTPTIANVENSETVNSVTEELPSVPSTTDMDFIQTNKKTTIIVDSYQMPTTTFPIYHQPDFDIDINTNDKRSGRDFQFNFEIKSDYFMTQQTPHQPLVESTTENTETTTIDNDAIITENLLDIIKSETTTTQVSNSGLEQNNWKLTTSSLKVTTETHEDPLDASDNFNFLNTELLTTTKIDTVDFMELLNLAETDSTSSRTPEIFTTTDSYSRQFQETSTTSSEPTDSSSSSSNSDDNNNYITRDVKKKDQNTEIPPSSMTETNNIVAINIYETENTIVSSTEIVGGYPTIQPQVSLDNKSYPNTADVDFPMISLKDSNEELAREKLSKTMLKSSGQRLSKQLNLLIPLGHNAETMQHATSTKTINFIEQTTTKAEDSIPLQSSETVSSYTTVFDYENNATNSVITTSALPKTTLIEIDDAPTTTTIRNNINSMVMPQTTTQIVLEAVSVKNENKPIVSGLIDGQPVRFSVEIRTENDVNYFVPSNAHLSYTNHSCLTIFWHINGDVINNSLQFNLITTAKSLLINAVQLIVVKDNEINVYKKKIVGGVRFKAQDDGNNLLLDKTTTSSNSSIVNPADGDVKTINLDDDIEIVLHDYKSLIREIIHANENNNNLQYLSTYEQSLSSSSSLDSISNQQDVREMKSSAAIQVIVVVSCGVGLSSVIIGAGIYLLLKRLRARSNNFKPNNSAS